MIRKYSSPTEQIRYSFKSYQTIKSQYFTVVQCSKELRLQQVRQGIGCLNTSYLSEQGIQAEQAQSPNTREEAYNLVSQVYQLLLACHTVRLVVEYKGEQREPRPHQALDNATHGECDNQFWQGCSGDLSAEKCEQEHQEVHGEGEAVIDKGRREKLHWIGFSCREGQKAVSRGKCMHTHVNKIFKVRAIILEYHLQDRAARKQLACYSSPKVLQRRMLCISWQLADQLAALRKERAL
ncbi:hypothetical protein FGO68_gene16176 [Halteria grandinella]|uniref:Uncharacterized protein n=1 Tax=Halteria grandinella TaxID=5974 RepID=A0A8J8SZJ7_HALGN|nr:hypothetical protein FGO68_gene16176 [Halteria grandinella]